MRRVRLFFEAAAHQGAAVEAILDRVAARVRGEARTNACRQASQWQELRASLEEEADARSRAMVALFDARSEIPIPALLRLVRQMHRAARCLGESFQAIPSGEDGSIRASAAEIADVLSGALQASLQAIAALGAHGVESDDVSVRCGEATPLVRCAATMAKGAMTSLLVTPNVDPRWAIAWRFVFQRLADAATTCGEITEQLEILRSELSVRRASAQQVLY